MNEPAADRSRQKPRKFFSDGKRMNHFSKNHWPLWPVNRGEKFVEGWPVRRRALNVSME